MTSLEKALRNLRWLPGYVWQRSWNRVPKGAVHVIIALADHYEPSVEPGTDEGRAAGAVQEQRVERWCREYPQVVEPYRDSDGYPFRHTYFYPAEQFDPHLIERLAEHCHAGWGEIEIHLHHGIQRPDTAENTRRVIAEFRDRLASRGCLSRWDGDPRPRYGFVHGNFALANSSGGACCGVDDEMQVLAETGCYADFSLPAAPNPAQVAKVNAIYECGLPLDRRAPQRRGRDLSVGRVPTTFPIIVQGPLTLDFERWRGGRLFPGIDNGELTTRRPPTLERLRRWMRAGITVRGRPDWVFVKLHCHGMDPRDDGAMLGEPMRQFLREITGESRQSFRPHFVTAREMVNILLAACDGREGNPGDYRDYRLRRIGAGRPGAAARPSRAPAGVLDS